jgi:hypothetical protein
MKRMTAAAFVVLASAALLARGAGANRPAETGQ